MYNLKIRIFKALLESVFLYNSECWGLNKNQENKINVFQRKLLRNILGINWHKNNWISNEELYEKTKQNKWSNIISHRRLRFFGHIARLDENAPAKVALYDAIRHTTKPRGRPKTNLINTIEKQLKQINIKNIEEGIEFSQDRKSWKTRIGPCLQM